MQQTIRTTIRLRKDLLDQSRLLAVKQRTSLQEAINNTLAKGFSYVSDIKTRRNVIKEIDKFRKGLANKKINVQSIVDQNKKELEIRTNGLFRHTSGE